MKLSDGILECPDSGVCIIDLEKIIKKFGEHSIISYYGLQEPEYRLVNLRASVKVTISTEDAEELIRRLHLVKVESPIFAKAGTYMTPSRSEKVKTKMKVPNKVLEVMKFVFREMDDLTEEEECQFETKLLKSLKGFFQVRYKG